MTGLENCEWVNNGWKLGVGSFIATTTKPLVLKQQTIEIQIALLIISLKKELQRIRIIFKYVQIKLLNYFHVKRAAMIAHMETLNHH
jgi:hypothetical protein